MAEHELEVEIVAEDRFVWSGPAQSVSARTAEGEIGILPGHTPMLAVLGDGDVVVQQTNGQTLTAHAEGGFFSVDNDRVVIVAGAASLDGDSAEQGAA
ncbi:F0F1 ATP synthase subunit epsilon [Citricoccus nitrophenolicus]|uniref:ATP synthase epsilon chain n=1 Tax=Citricoccus muralis TaxID=169134 RepID=A0A3D9LAI7_9MICC|nr:F0F1 ATP synthase subunit epsilon [Citricoccus muralis]REE02676.1 F-type H+-transporting ATPase subunit epsilon [Citricoccus muralis]